MTVTADQNSSSGQKRIFRPSITRRIGLLIWCLAVGLLAILGTYFSFRSLLSGQTNSLSTGVIVDLSISGFCAASFIYSLKHIGTRSLVIDTTKLVYKSWLHETIVNFREIESLKLNSIPIPIAYYSMTITHPNGIVTLNNYAFSRAQLVEIATIIDARLSNPQLKKYELTWGIPASAYWLFGLVAGARTGYLASSNSADENIKVTNTIMGAIHNLDLIVDAVAIASVIVFTLAALSRRRLII
ncbi:MAG TPA: hypothetical protein VIJ49_08490 [Aestuariivirga sp.]